MNGMPFSGIVGISSKMVAVAYSGIQDFTLLLGRRDLRASASSNLILFVDSAKCARLAASGSRFALGVANASRHNLLGQSAHLILPGASMAPFGALLL